MSKNKKFQRRDAAVEATRMNIITLEYARENGYTASFIRTLVRSLERRSKDAFRRKADGNYESRWDDGDTESPVTLAIAGNVNAQNAYALRKLAGQLR